MKNFIFLALILFSSCTTNSPNTNFVDKLNFDEEFDTNQFILEGQNGFLVDNWQGFEKAIRRIVNMSDREYLGLSTNCLNPREDFSLEN